MIDNLFWGGFLVKIEGMNVERFLMTLSSKGIVLKDVRRSTHNQFYLKTSVNCYRKLLVLCQQMCYNINVEKVFGFYKIIHFFKTRLAFTLCLVFCIISLFVFNTFVFQIKVFGAEKISYSEINQLLQTIDVNIGCQKKAVNINQVEHLLKEHFDEISLISVKIQGSCLIINIKETI